MPATAAIAWLPWTETAFARARAEARPVLLSIGASWCRHSADMDRLSYGDARVAEIINSRFVPIRVDADRRPDVAGRYDLGGWPTTAFLTPEGEILGGGTYVDGERLTEVLQRVDEAFAAGDHLRTPHGPGRPAAGEQDAATTDQIIEQVSRSFDARHGGFGDAPKFPHAAPVRLALAFCREHASSDWRDAAVTTLDAMGWGPLYDEHDGGFFRCARDRDWGRPSEEKLLEVNAALLSLYVEAFDTLQLARYAERAEDVLRYLQTWLADTVDGGWGGSQRADPAYHARHQTQPAPSAAAPPVDRTLYADWNAAMVSAALHAGRVMHDASLSEFAIRSLERVVLLCYRPGAGVAHYCDTGSGAGAGSTPGAPAEIVRGLLDDQVAMAVAHLDAFEATGNIVYEMMAEELALYSIRTMWDEQDGGFFDRAAEPGREVGLLRTRVKPFVSNCVAARMLARLARTAGHTDFGAYTGRTLAALARRAAAEGPLAAEYVLAARQCPQQ